MNNNLHTSPKNATKTALSSKEPLGKMHERSSHSCEKESVCQNTSANKGASESPHRTQSLFSAFMCAFRGIQNASKGRNFRIQSCFALVAILLGCALGVSKASWLAIVICIAVVLSLETLNTALEAVVDLVCPEYHTLAACAKDCAAGAVLIASIGSLIIGIIIFAPKLLALLGL